MLQNLPQKLRTWHCFSLQFFRFTLAPDKGHQTIFIADNALFSNNPAIQIAGQVFQRRRTGTGIFAVYNPVFAEGGFRYNKIVTSQKHYEFGSENAGQCVLREQILMVFGALP